MPDMSRKQQSFGFFVEGLIESIALLDMVGLDKCVKDKVVLNSFWGSRDFVNFFRVVH